MNAEELYESLSPRVKELALLLDKWIGEHPDWSNRINAREATKTLGREITTFEVKETWKEMDRCWTEKFPPVEPQDYPGMTAQQQVERSKTREQIRATFDKESDRAAAILIGAYLERILREVLELVMINSGSVQHLFSPSKGALGAFGVMIDIAYATGIVSKSAYNNLRTISKVRNAFAHMEHAIKFDAPEIIELCEKFDFGSDNEPFAAQGRTARIRAKRRFSLASEMAFIELDFVQYEGLQLVRSEIIF